MEDPPEDLEGGITIKEEKILEDNDEGDEFVSANPTFEEEETTERGFGRNLQPF